MHKYKDTVALAHLYVTDIVSILSIDIHAERR